MPNIDSTSVDCICATDPHCQSTVTLSGLLIEPNDGDDNTNYLVPGAIEGCFVIDTLLLSTLECYYLNSCLSGYISLIKYTPGVLESDIEWFDIHPLIYDEESSRFAENTSLSVIVREMMIEQWNPSSSFDRYFEVCAPSYCTYSDTAHTYSLISIIIKLMSIIGGLTFTLRLITPVLVKIVIGLLEPKVKRQPRGNYW